MNDAAADWPAAARVVMYDTLSGTNDYSVEMVRALAALLPLTVVTVDNTRLAAQDGARLLPVVPAYAKPQPRWRKALAMARAYAVLVRECLRDPRHTVLHVQFLRFERLELTLFGWLQRRGVRVVATAHNALPHDTGPAHAAIYRRWYAMVDAVHVLSAGVRRAIEHDLGVEPRRTVLIGHGPYSGLRRRYATLDAVEQRRRFGIAPERFVILQFGLFKPYKGVDRLAEAVIALPPQVRPLLVLAGAGPVDYLAGVRSRLQAGGRADDLLWLQRFVSDEELCGLLTLADLVVFPYVKVSQSGALFLAMTFDKACLCANLPGFRELLPDEAGLFVDTADTAAFAARLQTLQQDAAALASLRGALRRAAEAGFDWQAIALATRRLYVDVLGTPPGATLTPPKSSP